MDIEKLKYPIGKFEIPQKIGREQVESYLRTIAEFPAKLKEAVQGLTDEQLDTAYRPGGWSVRQVVHHCADSHMNALIRFKLAVTEDKPTIKPYLQGSWAQLPDSQLPVDLSLKILEGLHQRMYVLWRHFSEEDLEKCYIHPEHGKVFKLSEAMAQYDWHCRHHLAHILQLKQSMNW